MLRSLIVRTLGTSGLVLIMVALANVLVGRTLGVQGQGLVTAATLVSVVVAYGGEIGIPVATGYYINARAGERQQVIGTARLITVVLSVALTLGALVLILTLPLPSGTRGLALTFLPFITLTLLHRLHLTIAQADLRMALFNTARLAGAATYFILLLIYWLTESATTFRVVLALLAGNVVYCVLSVPFTLSRPAFSRDPTTAKMLLGYGLRAHIGNVPIDGLKLDQLILAVFLSPYQLGLYAAAMTVIIGNRVIGISVGTVCFPLGAKYSSLTGPERRDQFRRLLALTFILSAAAAGVEMIFAERAMSMLFGPDFGAAGPALQVLALASVFMNVRQVSADWLRGCGRPGVVAVAEGLGITCLVLLAFIFWDGTILPVARIVTVSAVVSCVWLAGAAFRHVPNRKGDGVLPVAAPVNVPAE